MDNSSQYDERRVTNRSSPISTTKRALIGAGIGAGLAALGIGAYSALTSTPTTPKPSPSGESKWPPPRGRIEPYSAQEWETWQPGKTDYDEKMVSRLRNGIKNAAAVYSMDPALLASVWGTETGGYSNDGKILTPGFHIHTKDKLPHFDDPARNNPNKSPQSAGPFHVTLDAISDAYDDISDSYFPGEISTHPLTKQGRILSKLPKGTIGQKKEIFKQIMNNPELAAWTTARYLRQIALGRYGSFPHPASMIYAYNIGPYGTSKSTEDRNNEYLKKFLNLYPEELIYSGLGVKDVPPTAGPINVPTIQSSKSFNNFMISDLILKSLQKGNLIQFPTGRKAKNFSAKGEEIGPAEIADLSQIKLDLAVQRLKELTAQLNQNSPTTEKHAEENAPIPIPVGRKPKNPIQLSSSDSKIIHFPE